jgi:hypothetical protein
MGPVLDKIPVYIVQALEPEAQRLFSMKVVCEEAVAGTNVGEVLKDTSNIEQTSDRCERSNGGIDQTQKHIKPVMKNTVVFMWARFAQVERNTKAY